MDINFGTVKTAVLQPAVTVSLSAINIERIVDNPAEKTVYVRLPSISAGLIKLPSLSDENYNNPPWTDELVLDATTAYVTAKFQ
jgi:hypothetical protein